MAVTPAAGYVSPLSALAIGGIAAFPSYFALLLRSRTRLDDSLDVFSAHGLGGACGALLTGVFAQKAWNGVADGALFGNPRQLAVQLAAIAATIAYSMVATWLVIRVVALVSRVRVAAREEGFGLDVV